MAATMQDPMAEALASGIGALTQGVHGYFGGQQKGVAMGMEQQAQAKKSETETKRQMDLELAKEDHKTKQSFFDAVAKVAGAGGLKGITLESLAKIAGMKLPEGVANAEITGAPKSAPLTFEQRKELAETSAGLKPPTATAFTARGFADKADQANRNLAALEKAKFSPGSSASGGLPNFAQPEQRQQFEQALIQFVNAILRRESGAAVPPDELVKYSKQYFPAFGDKPGVIKQKAEARKLAIANLNQEAAKVPSALPKEEAGEIERMGTPPGEKSPVLLISKDGGKTWKKK